MTYAVAFGPAEVLVHVRSVLRTITVLYHPDRDAVDALLALGAAGLLPVAVVNAAATADIARLEAGGVETIVNAGNAGLATAFNQGIGRALEGGATHIILFDQDSRPPSDMSHRLLALCEAAETAGRAVGCIAPVPVDRKRPGADTLARRHGDAGTDGLASMTTVISSGMLIPRTAIERVGGMWDGLFIDHVDHEWCFRARAAGLEVLVAVDVAMPHDMGDDGFRFMGRYKPIHRSPVRHYHIVRNTLWLARRSTIPARWRMIETLKLAVRVPAYVLFSADRGATLRSIGRALAGGLGRLPTIPRGWPDAKAGSRGVPPKRRS